MSIIGLSEKLRLPRRGKIRLGEKKLSKSGKEYPSALDFFACPEEIQKIYGDKPRKLNIMIPMEEREQFFPQAYKRYGSSAGLICRGNGEVATEIAEEGMKEIECQGKDCPHYQKGECKQIGNLQVILPKIKGLGVYQIDTSSYNSIVNINSGVEMIRGMLGRISWIPLILEVQMQEAHPQVKGKRIKTIIPVMSITSDVSVYDLLKMRLPAKQAEIDNKGVDEMPTLLYPKISVASGGEAKKLPEETTDKEQRTVEDMDGSIVTDEQRRIAQEKTIAAEKNEIERIDKLGKTEVKDEPEVLSEEEVQKEQAVLLDTGKDKPEVGRNQLNIRWHTLRKKLDEINFFGDDASYRDWLKFSFKVKSSKELSDEKMSEGIELMAKIFNKQEKK